jgi:hypothetical protein
MPTREQRQVFYDYADGKISTETTLARLCALFSQQYPSEVLVEGSYFRTADLPDILGRHMHALDEAGRREKQHWIEHHEPSPSTPSAEQIERDAVHAIIQSARSIAPSNYSRRLLRPFIVQAFRAGARWASSQPSPSTPSNEHEDMSEYAQNERRQRQVILDGWSASPPRIENMAPGTTFRVGEETYKIAPTGRILYAGWRLTPWDQATHSFDPSTIRDITPPPTHSKDNA